MKYKVLDGPIQIAVDTQAQTGEIIELPEADGTQLARWGIVEPIIEPEPVAPAEPVAPPEPPPTTTTAAKTTTTTTTAK